MSTGPRRRGDHEPGHPGRTRWPGCPSGHIRSAVRAMNSEADHQYSDGLHRELDRFTEEDASIPSMLITPARGFSGSEATTLTRRSSGCMCPECMVTCSRLKAADAVGRRLSQPGGMLRDLPPRSSLDTAPRMDTRRYATAQNMFPTHEMQLHASHRHPLWRKTSPRFPEVGLSCLTARGASVDADLQWRASLDGVTRFSDDVCLPERGWSRGEQCLEARQSATGGERGPRITGCGARGSTHSGETLHGENDRPTIEEQTAVVRALLKGIARGDIDDPAVVRRIALSVGVEVRPSGLLSMLQNIAAAITDHDPHMMLEQDDPPLRAAAVAAGEEGQRKMRGDPAPRVETPGEIRDDLAGRHTAVEEIAARLAEERINWPPLPRTGVPQPRTQKPAARVAAGRYRTESVVHATRLEAFLPVWDSSEPSAQEKRASSPGVQCDTAEASEDSNGGRVRSRRESRVERHNVEREHNEAGEERARGGGWQPWQQWNGGGVRRPREERDIEKRVAVMGFDDDFIGEETLERHGSNTEKDVHHGKTTMGRKGRRRPSLSTTGETRRTREEQEERCRVEDGKPGEVLGGSREERKGEPKDERETPQEKRKETCLEGGGTSKREEDVKKKRRRGLPGEVYWGQAEGRGVRKRKRRVLPGEEEEGTETMGKRMGETAKSRNEGWEKPGSKSREARKAREGENGMERAESDGEHAVSIGQAREERAPSDEAAATVWAKRVQKKTCAAHHSPSTRPGPGESAGHLAPSGGRVDDGSRHNTPVLPWESETGEDGMGSLSTHALGDMFSDRWLWAGV